MADQTRSLQERLICTSYTPTMGTGFFLQNPVKASPAAGPAAEVLWQCWGSQGSPIPTFMDLGCARGRLIVNSKLQVVEETSRQQKGFLQCYKNWQRLEETEQNLHSDFCVGSVQGDHEDHKNLGILQRSVS